MVGVPLSWGIIKSQDEKSVSVTIGEGREMVRKN